MYPGLCDECRLGWLTTLRPGQLTWSVNTPVGCCRSHPPLPFITISQPERLILILLEVGRLSRPMNCSKRLEPVPKTVYHSGCSGCLTLLVVLEIYLNFFYWKSWNATGILPGLLEISWCCTVCYD